VVAQELKVGALGEVKRKAMELKKKIRRYGK